MNTCDMLVEFIKELGDEYNIDAINEQGVSFYYKRDSMTRFSLVTCPMFGVLKGNIGLVVTKNCYPYVDGQYKLENPSVFDEIKNRITAKPVWIGNPPPVKSARPPARRKLSASQGSHRKKEIR